MSASSRSRSKTASLFPEVEAAAALARSGGDARDAGSDVDGARAGAVDSQSVGRSAVGLHPERAYARVAVALPMMRLFDYFVPEPWRADLAPGRRVRVPFHGRRIEATILELVAAPAAGVARIKAIDSLETSATSVPGGLLELAKWMSERTIASVGECIQAMVPAGVRRSKKGRRERTVALARTPAEAQAEAARLEAHHGKRSLILALLARHVESEGASAEPLALRALLARAKSSASPIATLERDGWIKLGSREVMPELAPDAVAIEDSFVPERLTFEQEVAVRRINAALDRSEGGGFLLHGVTGSGKTEVYLRAIERVIALGRGAIVLVPEIALTPQLVQRFSARFSRIAVMHSSLSDVERARAWNRIKAGEIDVAIGPRSALFAPFARLGLIVLDEEHEPSYKQESTPRYHARDTALERGRIEKAVVVLGSATPALESFQAANDRTLQMLSLPARVGGRPLPPITLVDMRQECQEQKRRAILSRCLVERARATLARGEQVIFFLNRRGYSTFVHCSACGWTQGCSRCAIHMTFHRQLGRSWCHYCGETASRPDQCPDCRAPGVKLWGFGTERIAEEVTATFPGARIERMDSDTMTTRGAYERAFNRLRRLEVDILMGTQMIAKGLDLPQVTLVGVLHADIALAFPDFRAAERTFQLVAQVAGRAGRGPAGGEVVVQCYRPDHYAITAARHHDYRRFATAELEFRRQAGYPPTTELIRILVDGADAEEVRVTALDMRDRCLAIAASGVGIKPGDLTLLGPVAAPIARLKGRHRVHLLLKLASNQALIALSRHHAETLLENPRRRPGQRGGVKVTIDVNPVAML